MSFTLTQIIHAQGLFLRKTLQEIIKNAYDHDESCYYFCLTWKFSSTCYWLWGWNYPDLFMFLGMEFSFSQWDDMLKYAQAKNKAKIVGKLDRDSVVYLKDSYRNCLETIYHTFKTEWPIFANFYCLDIQGLVTFQARNIIVSIFTYPVSWKRRKQKI